MPSLNVLSEIKCAVFPLDFKLICLFLHLQNGCYVFLSIKCFISLHFIYLVIILDGSVFGANIYNCQSQNHQLPLPIDRFFLCPPPPQPTPNQPIKHFLINTHQGRTAFISTRSNGTRLETIKSMSLVSVQECWDGLRVDTSARASTSALHNHPLALTLKLFYLNTWYYQ